MESTNWIVHKFGGSSVANAARYRGVSAILDVEPGDHKATVVSAMSGITDMLIGLVDAARARDDYRTRLDAVYERHVNTARELLGESDAATALQQAFARDRDDIADVLRAVYLSRSYSEFVQELVAGYGELWSAQLLCAYLQLQKRSCTWLDAREILVVRPGELGPVIDWTVSKERMRAWMANNTHAWVVVTGYIASTPDGIPTTLKRNGSDFSASIFGALMDASEITIWTDVDGVLSADPRRVPEAVVLDSLGYDEAMELAYFGAKVIHPRTMSPAVERAIPIYIRNTFNPKHPGSRIHRAEVAGPARGAAHAVKGFTTVDAITMVNVEGTGMIGVPGVAQRVFGSLRAVGVSVVMISQASSEHSICFAVPEKQGALARDTITREFGHEIEAGEIQRVEIVEGCSILAAVGKQMAHTPGVAAKLFAALAGAGINVRAIAQGSSEKNISVVIDRADSTRALRAAHAGFFLSNHVLSVGVIGPGQVGRALLKQLAAQSEVLRSQLKVDLRVRGVLNSSTMQLGEPALSLDTLDTAKLDQPANLDAFVKHIRADHLPHAVIIDCSASEAVAAQYASWLRHGIHVITPNKLAGAGPLERYRSLRNAALEHGSHWFYEATVGAGLPVITTLRDLIRTGDRIEKVEGILSGTLSYVFNTFARGVRFSDVVLEARRRGYTEPDPRDDLSGMDVARKLVILAREMGVSLELSNVSVEDLVPAALRAHARIDDFLAAVPQMDDAMEARRVEAETAGEVLRYVGVVDAQGKASVGLRRYPVNHPFARSTASDNVIVFTTSRYHDLPLIVQGPGAGPDVTAAGVFADLLRLAGHLGAPS